MTKIYLEPEDIQKMEDSAEYMRDQLLVRLMFRLGCRVSEALGISVDDIDFERGTITIQHLKVRTKFSCPKCGTRLNKSSKFCSGCGERVENLVAEEKEHKRFRILPVDDDTLNMIRQYIDSGGTVYRDGRHLLFGISRNYAWKIITDLARKAGLSKLVNPETGKVHNVSPHKLRDAFAVHAVKIDDSGDGLRMLQEHLGHQSIATTMRYRKVSGEEQKQWYQRIMS